MFFRNIYCMVIKEELNPENKPTYKTRTMSQNCCREHCETDTEFATGLLGSVKVVAMVFLVIGFLCLMLSDWESCPDGSRIYAIYRFGSVAVFILTLAFYLIFLFRLGRSFAKYLWITELFWTCMNTAITSVMSGFLATVTCGIDSLIAASVFGFFTASALAFCVGLIIAPQMSQLHCLIKMDEEKRANLELDDVSTRRGSGTNVSLKTSSTDLPPTPTSGQASTQVIQVVPTSVDNGSSVEPITTSDMETTSLPGKGDIKENNNLPKTIAEEEEGVIKEEPTKRTSSK